MADRRAGRVVVVRGTEPPRPAGRRLEIAASGPATSGRRPGAGDVLAALAGPAAALVLIDGYYFTVPAVTHKELLYALDAGVRVIGAASLGALRAAELAPLGMTGVGRVFERVPLGGDRRRRRGGHAARGGRAGATGRSPWPWSSCGMPWSRRTSIARPPRRSWPGSRRSLSRNGIPT